MGSSSQLHLTGVSGSVFTDKHIRGTREGTKGWGSCLSCHGICQLNGEETGMVGTLVKVVGYNCHSTAILTGLPGVTPLGTAWRDRACVQAGRYLSSDLATGNTALGQENMVEVR